jgi:DNA-binding transcriptional MerR regulator
MAERTEQLLGTGEIAARFGLSISTTKRLDRLGVLPTARRIAGRRIWSMDDIPVIEERLEARRNGRREVESGQAA